MKAKENTKTGILRIFLSKEQFEENLKFYNVINKIDATLLERIRDIYQMFEACGLTHDEKLAYIASYNSMINEHEQSIKIEYFS